MSDLMQEKQLGEILENLSDELDVTPSQYEDAERKYKAVGEWLATPGSLLADFRPEIYPQGSIRLGTAVKPVEGNEFDVDLVCEMKALPALDQKTVKDLVGTRLSDNENYRRMLKEKKRCWRLDYAGQFHMDILPARPDLRKGNGCVLVPDRDFKEWKESNPKGYASWFEDRMVVIRAKMARMYAEIEDLPDNGRLRTPLQRAVQILKRYRDVVFKNKQDNAPLSIIITTLAAKAYTNEADLFIALMEIIQGMPRQIQYINGQPAVLNPTNPAENFAEKWISNPELYEIFRQWLGALRRDLLSVLPRRGMAAITEDLSPMFGEHTVSKAVLRYADNMELRRSTGLLRMTSGSGTLGTMAGTPLRKNTFFGD